MRVKLVNGIEFQSETAGVWTNSSETAVYRVSPHHTLKTKYTLTRQVGDSQTVIQHGSTIGELLTIAAEHITAEQKAAAPVAIVTVTESAVVEKQAELTEESLVRRCKALNGALVRLHSLCNSRGSDSKADRRKQGELLLSAVGCLRLSVLVVSASLQQRKLLTDCYSRQTTRLSELSIESRKSVLKARTYRTSGMFPRTEIAWNDSDRRVTERLNRLSADTATLKDYLCLNESADRICAILQSAELLVADFCSLRGKILQEFPSSVLQNGEQVLLVSILLASQHSDTWKGCKNSENTVCGINGQLLKDLESFGSNRLPDDKIADKLTVSGLRIDRTKLSKKGKKGSRVSWALGEQRLSYLRHSAGKPYWQIADRLSAYWHNRDNSQDSTAAKGKATDFQWNRQTFKLDSELKGSIPARHKLLKLAETLELLSGQTEERSLRSYSVAMQNSEKLALWGTQQTALRVLLRLHKRFGESADCSLRQRLSALQRLRAIAKSAVCYDGVRQIVVSRPQIVGSLNLTDSETGLNFSVSVACCEVETGTSENREYFLSGELTAEQTEVLNPVSLHSYHSRVRVITFHCSDGQTVREGSYLTAAEETVMSVCSMLSADTATETDRLALSVLLSRCAKNIALAQQNRQKRWLKTATPEQIKAKQRQETAGVLLRLRKLETVYFADSLSAGNCNSGTQQFMVQTLQIPATTVSVAGSELAKLWKRSGYRQNTLFLSCISAAEKRQQQQKVGA